MNSVNNKLKIINTHVKNINNSSNFSNINTFIGIDVGKFFIDVYFSLTGEYFLSIENNETSIKKLIAEIKKSFKTYNNKNKTNFSIENTLTVIDLTGNYEIICRDTFYNNGFKNIHLADGRKIKCFRQSKKLSTAKTDKSDAQMLSLYGEQNLDNLIFYKKEEIDNDLKELQKLQLRIDDLKYLLVQEKNRFKAPSIPDSIKKNVGEMLDFIEIQIEKLEKDTLNIINSNEELKTKFNILKNQHGIGDITAKHLITFLPELGKINRNKISALSGTAPIARDSGTIKGYRTTKGCGRKNIKHTLFMSMLSILRKKDSHLQYFYNSLINKGKTKKSAYVACMRKFIIYLRGLMKKDFYKNVSYGEKI